MAANKRQIADSTRPGARSTASQMRDRTLSDRAYERILSMIVGGEIPVGGKLPTEQSLSEQLGISRPVLRQALRQLREDDVIVSRQGSGSYVQRRPKDAVLISPLSARLPTSNGHSNFGWRLKGRQHF